MTQTAVAAVILVLLAAILVQEFGIYSIAVALAYLLAAIYPAIRLGVIPFGLLINVLAGSLHFGRALGIHVGDDEPIQPRMYELKAGMIHLLSVTALGAALLLGNNPGE